MAVCLYPALSQVPAILLHLCNLHIKERITIQTKCGCDYTSYNKGYTPCKEMFHMYEELDHNLPTVTSGHVSQERQILSLPKEILHVRRCCTCMKNWIIVCQRHLWACFTRKVDSVLT